MLDKIGCVIAGCSLIFILIAIILNSYYINNTADCILTLIEDNADIEVITRYWESKLTILKLTISQKDLEEIALALDEAIFLQQQDNSIEYKKAMARLKRTIAEIKRQESFTLENIF